MEASALNLGVGFTLPGDEAPYERTADWVRDQSFSGVMIGFDPMWDDEETERVGKAFADRGLAIYEVAAYTSLVHKDVKTRRDNIEGVKRKIQQAAIVGARCVATVGGSAAGWAPHPMTRSNESWRLLVDAVQEILDTTPETVTFCLEPWPPTVLPNCASLVRVIQEVDNPQLGILFDPTNLVTIDNYFETGSMIDEAFDRLGERFAAVHCKDILWRRDFMHTGLEEVVPGRGNLDYDTFLRRVVSSRKELPLIVEHLKEPERVIEAASYIRYKAETCGYAIK